MINAGNMSTNDSDQHHVDNDTNDCKSRSSCSSHIHTDDDNDDDVEKELLLSLQQQQPEEVLSDEHIGVVVDDDTMDHGTSGSFPKRYFKQRRYHSINSNSKSSSTTSSSTSSTYCSTSMIHRMVVKIIQYSIYSIVLLGILCFMILYIGYQIEQYHVNHAPDTTIYYNQHTNICGMIVTTTTASSTAGGSSSLKKYNSNTNDRTSASVISSTKFDIQSYPSKHVFLEHANHSTYNNMVNMKKQEHLGVTTTTEVITAHCGDCGSCSNPNDIAIYDATSTTLFTATTQCAKATALSIINPTTTIQKTATTCMEQAVPLTLECNNCWVNNIICDLQLCIFTCLWYTFFYQDISGNNGNDNNTTTTGSSSNNKALNICTKCDEKRCGPQFITCAGANRRRCGIMSDIIRDNTTEVCPMETVQPYHWWNTIPNLQTEFQEYYYHNGKTTSSSSSSSSSNHPNVNDDQQRPSPKYEKNDSVQQKPSKKQQQHGT